MAWEITGVGAALASAKTLLDLAKSANDLNIATKISAEVINLQTQLLDVQEQALSLQRENRHLLDELEKSRRYAHHHSVDWKILSDGVEDGPYCPTCIGQGKEMRLVLYQHASQDGEDWITHCPISHVDPRAKPQGFAPVRQEQRYKIPKSLTRQDYFYR